MKASPFNQLAFLFCAGMLAFSATSCTNSTSTDAAASAADTTAAPAPAPSMGVLTITSSADLSLADYDKVAAALVASGDWTKDWTYHAVGTMQPKGVYSIGVYPSQEALDRRRAIYKDLFPKLGVNVPPPVVREVQNIIAGAQPAEKPAGAMLVSFDGKGMTAEGYDKTLKDLEAAGVGAPAGRIYHVCYKTDEGLKVIDVWESEALFNAFGDKLMPILKANAIDPGQPAMHPLHNWMTGS